MHKWAKFYARVDEKSAILHFDCLSPKLHQTGGEYEKVFAVQIRGGHHHHRNLRAESKASFTYLPQVWEVESSLITNGRG